MTGSTIIDVVIGLIFIYLLYSMFATILQEIISTIFRFRAKVLEMSIIRMLEDGKSDAAEFQKKYGGTLRLFKKIKLIDEGSFKIAKSFYYHPLIKYLAENDRFSQPSYMTGENFSKVLVDLLRGPGGDQSISNIKASVESRKVFDFSQSNLAAQHSLEVPPQSGFFIASLWVDSHGDLERFKSALERWFADTQDHALGWYKRHIQKLLFALGFLVAISFNVDTIEIATKLFRDPILSSQLADRAQKVVEQRSGTEQGKPKMSDEEFARANKELIKEIDNTNSLLGLGWDLKNCVWFFECSKFSYLRFFAQLLGWFITALAISLGAPFWFDLLNKFINLRTAGKRPEGEEKKVAANTGTANNDRTILG